VSLSHGKMLSPHWQYTLQTCICLVWRLFLTSSRGAAFNATLLSTATYVDTGHDNGIDNNLRQQKWLNINICVRHTFNLKRRCYIDSTLTRNDVIKYLWNLICCWDPTSYFSHVFCVCFFFEERNWPLSQCACFVKTCIWRDLLY
jgi:hypothetical protein